jgi:tRNA dimethylallyltransferase
MEKVKLVIFQGATGIGKSSIAEEMAAEFDAEIISADSRQVYRYLDIGTAKPDKNTLRNYSYHLIDIINPDQKYSAGQFRRDAANCIREIHQRNKPIFIAGGTGFYINSLIKGLAPVPPVTKKAQQKIAEFIHKSDHATIYNYLQKVDPVSALRIEKNDLHRQQRALEVYESSGKPLSSYWQETISNPNYDCLNILLTADREFIYNKISTRIDEMLNMGLIGEIRSLLDKGYKQNDPGMITVGYREFYPWLDGVISYMEAIDIAKQHTRNYAKRQLTWYRKQEFNLTLTMNDLNLSTLRDNISKFLS